MRSAFRLHKGTANMKRTTGRNNQATTTSIAAPCISLVSVQEQGLLSEQPRLNRSIIVDHIDAFVYKLKTAFPILRYTSCHFGRSSITLHYSVMLVVGYRSTSPQSLLRQLPQMRSQIADATKPISIYNELQTNCLSGKVELYSI